MFNLAIDSKLRGWDLVIFAKFGLEGWTESLAVEIAPFGIRTMLVKPGFFRTELLTQDSTTLA